MTTIKRRGVESVALFDGPKTGREYVGFDDRQITATAMESGGNPPVRHVHPDGSRAQIISGPSRQRARKRKAHPNGDPLNTVGKKKPTRPASAVAGWTDPTEARRLLFPEPSRAVESKSPRPWPDDPAGIGRRLLGLDSAAPPPASGSGVESKAAKVKKAYESPYGRPLNAYDAILT